MRFEKPFYPAGSSSYAQDYALSALFPAAPVFGLARGPTGPSRYLVSLPV
jgi:hypothetical protein